MKKQCKHITINYHGNVKYKYCPLCGKKLINKKDKITNERR